MPMTLVIYILFGLIEIFFGVLVLLKSKNKLDHRMFLAMTLFFGLWTIAIGILVTPVINAINTMRFMANAMLFFGLAGTFFFYMFSISFQRKINENKIFNYIYVAFFLIFFFILLFFNDAILSGVFPGKPLASKLEFNFLGYGLYAIIFILNILLASINLFQTYQKAQGIYKQQVRYIFLGLSLMLALSAVMIVILPAFGNSQFVFLSPIYPIVFIITAAYAMLRYRLLEIEFLLKKVIFYFFLSTFIFGIYLMVTASNRYFFPFTPAYHMVPLFLSSLIIAIIFEPIREKFDALTVSFFFRKKYDYEKLLESIVKRLSSVEKVDQIIGVIGPIIKLQMHINDFRIYFSERSREKKIVFREYGTVYSDNRENNFFDQDHPLIDWLRRTKLSVESEEFRYRYGHLYQGKKIKDIEKSILQISLDVSLKAVMVVPILVKENLLGFFTLGSKINEDHFTKRDIVFFEMLGHQIGIAYESVKLYEKMLNTERLSIIGTMAAGIAHEIRNPLASIKTFIQMLPNKHHNPEFMQRFLEIVPSEIERLSGITADLLNFSRPSSPNIETIQINQICERVLTLLGGKIRKKNLQVEKKIEELPAIAADGQQLSQVLLNLMLNAVQAAPVGGLVGLRTFTPLDAPSRQTTVPSHVQVVVYDNGPGIKQDDLENVFQPFFTTKTEGTGLGLATCRRIVEAHSGLIWAESPPGKGAHLNVLLPIAKAITAEEAAVKNI